MKRKLADSKVCPIGLGCMGMSEFYGDTNEEESLLTLQRAWEMGVRHFDTADCYGIGHNEELLARFLKTLGSAAQEAFIATKCGIEKANGDTRVLNGSPKYIKEACERSLKRLGVETISLYYLHRLDPKVPVEESVGAMAELVAQGKIRAIGLSEVSAHTLRRAHKVHPLAALQNEYSLWTRDCEESVLSVCKELDIALVAYSPLGRGFLTGSIRNAAELSENDFRLKTPRFQGSAFDANLQLADEVVAFAAKLQVTPAQLCLAWVLAQGENLHVIPGTKRRKYLEDNMGALALNLTVEQVSRLSAILPQGAAVGARYSPGGMVTLNA